MAISPYNYILSKPFQVSPVASYTTELQKRINKSFEKEAISKEKVHFIVKALVDPLNYYMKLRYPELNKISPEVRKRWDRGDTIHSMAGDWLARIDKRVETEVHLDGSIKGLLLTGRYDAKIQNSIYEIKSKGILPSTREEIIEKHPSDIEQLAIYTILDNLNPKINYLVYVSQENLDIRVFKVTIKDPAKIFEFTQKRMSLLGNAIKKGEIQELGCCRYCPTKSGESCPFYEKCSCFELDKLPCGVLDFIDIEEEFGFKEKLVKIRSEAKIPESDLMTLTDIIMPKKRILKLKAGLVDESFKEKGRLEYEKNRGYFNGVMYKFDKDISKTNEELKNFHKFPDVYKYRSKFSTYKDVNNFKGIWLPSIKHVVPGNNEKQLERPHDYKIAELGILCLMNGCKSGLIFQFYPNLDNQCRVFKVEYKYNVEQGQGILAEAVELIKNTGLKDLEKLYDCPFGCPKCKISDVCQDTASHTPFT